MLFFPFLHLDETEQNSETAFLQKAYPVFTFGAYHSCLTLSPESDLGVLAGILQPY